MNIDTLGKRVHFAVPATAGVMLRVKTIISGTPTLTSIDTAITLFDATGTTRLAANDDAYPVDSVDSELLFRPASTTTLCLRVEDSSTWYPTLTPRLPSPNQFGLLVSTLSTLSNASVDAEPNDSTPQAVTVSAGVGLIGGVLSPATDVDVFSFTVPSTAGRVHIGVPPAGIPSAAGVNGAGATLPAVKVSLQTTGGAVLGELVPPTATPALMSNDLIVPVSLTSLRLVVTRPAGLPLSSAPNDFYGLITNTEDEPTREAETSAGMNDTRATGQALAMITDTANPKLRLGSVLGFLPPGDTNDWFTFSVTAGTTVDLLCAAARHGSGLQGFTATLYGTGTTALRSEVEGETADLLWSSTVPGATNPSVVVATASSMALRFNATGQSPTNIGTYYRCIVSALAP